MQTLDKPKGQSLATIREQYGYHSTLRKREKDGCWPIP